MYTVRFYRTLVTSDGFRFEVYRDVDIPIEPREGMTIWGLTFRHPGDDVYEVTLVNLGYDVEIGKLCCFLRDDDYRGMEDVHIGTDRERWTKRAILTGLYRDWTVEEESTD